MGERLRIAITGAAGKMGRSLVHVITDSPDAVLTGAVVVPGQAHLGQDAGLFAGSAACNVPLTSSLIDVLDGPGANAIIDFTSPAATAMFAAVAAERRVPLVIGTTGLGLGARRAVESAAQRTAVVLSPNMSLGVNLLFGLTARAAKALGDSFDVEIVEMHHRQKRDAPSGTALRMAEGIAGALGRDLGKVGNYGRHGDIGPRPEHEIGVMTVRGGDVVGEHTAYFLGASERIEIRHAATSREAFARGAVRAAFWLRDRPPGLYDMQDVLGLK